MANQPARLTLNRDASGSGNSASTSSMSHSLHSIREARESMSSIAPSPYAARPIVDWRGHSNSPYMTTAGYRPPNVAPDVYTPPIFAMPQGDYFSQSSATPSPPIELPPTQRALGKRPKANNSPPLLERRGIVRSDTGTYRVRVVPPDSREARLLRADVYGEMVGNSPQSPLMGAAPEQVDGLFKDAALMRIESPRAGSPRVVVRAASSASSFSAPDAQTRGGIKGLVASIWAKLAHLLSQAPRFAHKPWAKHRATRPADGESPAPPLPARNATSLAD